MKRTAIQILGDIRESGIAVTDAVHLELSLLYNETCRTLVARVPKEVWAIVMRTLCSVSPGDTKAYSILACVSRLWNAIASGLIAEACQENGPQCAREVVHCRDARHIVVTEMATLRDEDIMQLPQLTRLVDLVSSRVSFTARGITALSQLQVLHLHRKLSTSLSLFAKNLPALTDLDLWYQLRDSSTALSQMTNLTSLSVYRAFGYDDSVLRGLTRLTHLNLGCQQSLTDGAVSSLTSLTSLCLGPNHVVTGAGLLPLTGLLTLDLSYNNNITDESLSQLTQLETLLLKRNTLITGRGIAPLTRLKRLNLDDCPEITTRDLVHLTRLEVLGSAPYSWVTLDDVPHTSRCRGRVDADSLCACYTDAFNAPVPPPQGV